MELANFHTYTPIQPGQIRLCRFIKGEQYLSAHLKTFFLDDRDCKYTALSYTWSLESETNSKPRHTWALKIDGRFLPVLESLKSFIEALDTRGILLDRTWWWIDSICIDQGNSAEKDEQMKRMGEIYEKAREVIVWLGRESEDSDEAIEFIHDLREVRKKRVGKDEMRRRLLEGENEKKWMALERLFSRKWWTRVWTIQECVIPENISFWCGKKVTSRKALFDALLVADECNYRPFKDTDAFHQAFHRRRAWQLWDLRNRKQFGLLALVAYFCGIEATDQRDRLYGLVGLCTEDHGLVLNSALSVDEVYKGFAQSFIEKHKSLDIISFASLFTAIPGSTLPSWVPDWRAKQQPFVVPLMVSQSSSRFVGNFRPRAEFVDKATSTAYSAAGSSTAECIFQHNALLAQGYLLDEIDGIAEGPDLYFVQSSGRHLDEHFFPAPRSPLDILAAICRCLTLDCRDRYLRYPMPTKVFLPEFQRLCQLLVSRRQDAIHKLFKEWFESTRSLLVQGKSLEDTIREVWGDEAWMSNPVALDTDSFRKDTFYGRFFDVVGRMSLRLMTSYNGRIGMVPRQARPGDLVCILFGCSVPVLLRKTRRGDGVTIVGECFVEGCMQGEALEQGDIKEECFRIM